MMSASAASSKNVSRHKPLAACMAAVFALSAPAPALAAVWVVSNCLDDGSAGTLRWAAAGAVSGDTIDLTGVNSSSTTGCAATTKGGFTVALPIYNGRLNVAGGVTINGPNASSSVLAVSSPSNTPASRLFYASGAVTINNLGLKYGGGNSVSTGGCLWASGNITLTNVDAYKCYTYSNGANARGGAIYSFLGNVTMTNSTVTDSSATSVSGNVRGGSVYAFGGVTLHNSVISNSTATTQTGYAAGGGLFAFGSGGGNVSLYNSSVSGTSSVTKSGGLHAYGGAMESHQGTTYLYFSAASGTATTQSTGKARGGAIYSKGSVEIAHYSQVNACTAYSKGSPSASRGGCVYTQGNAAMLYSLVQGGTAQRGGGIYALGGFTSKYSIVNICVASSGGGCVISKGGNSFIHGTTIAQGSGQGYSGLDLFPGGNSTVAIYNSTLWHNSGTTGPGAAYLKAYHVTMDNTTVAYNTSPTGVSAVQVVPGNAGSTFDMHSTLIASNAAGSGRSDLFVGPGMSFSASSGHDLVRDPGSGVPTGTITGTCANLRFVYHDGAAWAYFLQRPSSKSAVIDAGSNPDGLNADQRGGSPSATSPARVSGIAADIGSYEVQQNDIVFNGDFDGCLL